MGRGIRRRLINTLLHVCYFLLLRLEVSGKENVPLAGPLILMINHIDALDPFIVVGIFPRPVTPMSKVEVFNIPLIGFLTEAYGTIPIQRGQGDSRALRRSLQVLKEGGALLISPEGTRSPTYSLQRGKEGMALLAARTGAPIIPVAITGTEQRGRYWRSLRRVPVRIAIGKTFHLEPGEERPRRPILRAMTDEAMYRLAATLPPEYRGIYSNLDKVTQVHVVALPNSVEEAFDGIPQIRTHRPEGINPLPGNHDDGLD